MPHAGSAAGECAIRPLHIASAQELWHRLTQEAERVAPSSRRRLVSQPDIVPRNFIDDEIFGAMRANGIRWTVVASDGEFLRRVHLDLTGQIPSAERARTFLSDSRPDKRERLVDELLDSEEFSERWTLWMGDLVGIVSWSPELGIYPNSAECFSEFVRAAFRENRPYDRLVREVITATGHPWKRGTDAGYWVRHIVSYAPVQDTYDNLSAGTAEHFLGLEINCVSCHNGRGHLEKVNSSLAVRTRQDFWKNAAFFARDYAYLDGPDGTDYDRWPCAVNEYGWGVAEVVGGTCSPLYPFDATGDRCPNEYRANTTTGARTPRRPLPGDPDVIEPAFFLGGEGPRPGEKRRDAYARILTAHPQFARATVNYLWKELFGIGIVEPVNSHDLFRQDPATLEPGVTLQPSHPVLLTRLAEHFAENGYDFRDLLKTIVVSNAYQLSSKYTPGIWNERWTPYYARHYPRRMLAESIVDAVARATSVPLAFEASGQVHRAMQFYEPSDPWPSLPGPVNPGDGSRSSLIRFMNSFGRGDRISIPRSNEGSILQALRLMNHPFVTSRVKAENNSTVQRLIATTSDPGTIVDELYLATLSRPPTAAERTVAIDLLRNGELTQNVEDLQFALINTLEFLYR